MSVAAVASLPAPATGPVAVGPPVAGYVEAVTANAVLGWAWAAGQPDRLRMELRLGAERSWPKRRRTSCARISPATASATAGTPSPCRCRRRTVRAWPSCACSRACRTARRCRSATPPVDGGLEERLQALQRGMEMLVGSQRVLHRNLQAALLARAGFGRRGAGGRSEAQRSLQDGFATLEVRGPAGSRAGPGAAPRRRRCVTLGHARPCRGRRGVAAAVHLGAAARDAGLTRWPPRHHRSTAASTAPSLALRRSGGRAARSAVRRRAQLRLQPRRAGGAAVQHAGVQPRAADPGHPDPGGDRGGAG